MLFGIDFDGVFKEDPELFREIIALLKNKGHDAIVVTGRSETGIWGEEVKAVVGDLVPCIFAGLQYKMEATAEAGYKVNVWIDDNPQYIGRQDEKIIKWKGKT